MPMRKNGSEALLEHGADFINGAVGVAHQQQGAATGKLFFDNKMQGHAGLARSGRAYQQEIVASLHGMEQHFVVVGMPGTGEADRRIAYRLPLTK